VCFRFGRGTDARVLSDFRGLEGADATTKAAMMDFSYYLTLGNMDEAFKAVRAIKSTAVWETMARMCVATRRIDVAAYCLGKMGNAVGARALRAAVDEYQEEEARVATLAVHLGMTDDAEALLAECGRWDLLNKLYQSCGRWDDAIELAKTKDRAHLRNTYHAAGKYQESCGNTDSAIEYYELSQTHLFEVLRLLSDDPEAQEAYVKNPGNDPIKRKHVSLLKWWGGYLESLGEDQMDRALEYYSQADDTLGQVRVLCFSQQHDKAKELVDSSGDRAAAYYLAREFEAMRAESFSGASERAIEFVPPFLPLPFLLFQFVA
jgi:intraflagellar transport protein 140